MLKLGLIGKGISQSYSPGIHKIGANLSQVACSYDLLDITDASQLGPLIADLRLGRWHGFNITIPFKSEILRFLDVYDRSAVNTIYVKNGLVCGTSTDGPGFERGLLQMKVARSQMQVLNFVGCGGAVLSIIEYWQLIKPKDQASLQINILSRSEESARALRVKEYCMKVGIKPNFYCDFEDFRSILPPQAIVVNAMPKSPATAPIMTSDQLISLPREIVFYDLNYGARSSGIFERAAAYFPRFTDGLPMLVEQARQSQKIWWNSHLDFEDLYEATAAWIGNPLRKDSSL
ncbi:MAG: hypothetical protein WCI18_03540 [Pseudomonadota bacterium]